MHHHILTGNQVELLPLLKTFSGNFYLAGGTAIALHLGHRHSIDFDLFTGSNLRKSEIWKKLMKFSSGIKKISEDTDQLNVIINNLKITFLSYPFAIEHPVHLQKFISLPTLISLASMKAYALGRRAKWKDYADLFFILRDHYSIEEIKEEAIKNFGGLFSEKLFREQLAFHKDIDYSEAVEYTSESPSDEEIKKFLIHKATDLEL
ncbi:MAG: nucleotidyl transferase AbiEii/AbiGii toxin family protein [Bacteroidales bacterium]|nr:nucleotidyl transferase AbiEii/AbiGii toxin family protein [Bacteroidales bacterium]